MDKNYRTHITVDHGPAIGLDYFLDGFYSFEHAVNDFMLPEEETVKLVDYPGRVHFVDNLDGTIYTIQGASVYSSIIGFKKYGYI